MRLEDEKADDRAFARTVILTALGCYALSALALWLSA